MAEFSPNELDRLEDALEGLEDVEDLGALDLPEPLRERLADYQGLLRASREALPMEEVPDGLLDGVLAEAREAQNVEPERPSLWKRWRAAVIPVVALAGTTAAVLWIVKPNEPMVEASEVPVETAADETAPGAAAPTAKAEAGAEQAVSPPPEMAEAEERVPAPMEAEPTADAKQASKPAAPARKADGNDAYDQPAPAPAPTQQPIDKDGVWQTIEDGDRARRQGDCDSAERLYLQAEAAAAANTKARAQAWMGLGLCKERRGEDGSKYLNDAQAADPSLRSKIESERSASKSVQRKGKPAPKKKSKRPAFDDPMEQNALPRD